MRRNRILELVRRSAGALLLLGSVGVASDSLVVAQDANCACPTPSCQPQCSDEIYKRAGDRLAQQLQQMGSQPCAQGQCASGCNSGCNAGCDSGCNGSCHSGSMFKSMFAGTDGCEEEKKEPWALVDVFTDECGKNWLKDNGTTISGWIQMGYQSNPDGAFTGNGPFLNQREHSSFNLNQAYIYIAKVADGSKGFDWGYRADFLFGVDGNEAQAFGNVNQKHWDYLNGWGGPSNPQGTHGPYEFALPQLYGEVAAGNLSVKAGHFYTPIGYEVVTSPDNFFLSRQITFYNSEPFTHTGALATYKVDDKLTVIGGYELGWDTGFYQYNKGSMGIGGFTYAATDKTTLTYAGGFGNFGWRGEGAINSFILSQKWTDKLMSVHQFDVLNTSGVPTAVTGSGPAGANFATNGIAGDSTGLINYLFYEIDAKWKAGSRLEWYKADGVSYNTFTYGVNYKPTANLTIRPEMRHNWSPAGKNYAGALPGINSVYGHSNIFGVDAIFKF
ncbi:MAG: outer membrane beta-barrel protein [Planctomycetia bacterium]|nr:outer membrane beta-barrel protein [Planctomycetia bacterium]